METVLKTRNLTKRYGQKLALDDVSMTINKGDIYGFIGKNGAGKTTLMRIILSLSTQTSGSYELFGGMNQQEAGKRIGALIETPGLYKNCTAKGNLERFALLYGLKNVNYDEILNFVGLGDTNKKNAGQFSLGMRQRLGIAIAMLGNPEFMVLDEPVNGLDPTGMKEIRDLIVKLNQERGITVLISSHLLEELSKMVTKYGIVSNGRLVEELSAEELEKKSETVLTISVDDTAKAMKLLSDKVPADKIEVKGSNLVLTDGFDERAEFNKLLVNQGVSVDQLILKTADLEEYFLARIGDR